MRCSSNLLLRTPCLLRHTPVRIELQPGPLDVACSVTPPFSPPAKTFQFAQPAFAREESAGALPDSIAARSASARQPSMPMSSTRLPAKSFSPPGPLAKAAMALAKRATARERNGRILVGGTHWYGCGESIVQRATSASARRHHDIRARHPAPEPEVPVAAGGPQ